MSGLERPGSQLKLSYSNCASSIPHLCTTIGKLLEQRAESCPEKAAMIFYKDGVKLTFGQLLAKADMLAAGLRSLGFQKGDRIGIWGPNTWEWIVTQYGTARAGLILVNVNPLFKAQELQFALEKSECRGLVMAEGFGKLNYYNILTEIIPEITSSSHGAPLKSQELPDFKYVLTMGSEKQAGCYRFEDILSQVTASQVREVVQLQDTLQFDDPISIQFTSGTTGTPKGACLTHHNIVNNSYFIGIRNDFDKHDAVICCPAPLYHCFGMVLGSMMALTHGSTLVWPSPSFNPEYVLKSVQEYRCTSLYGVPTMFIDILNHPLFGKVDLSSVTGGMMGGAPLPIETMKELVVQLGIKYLAPAYGSTETSPITFMMTTSCPLDKRLTTVGRPLDHVEAKVVDRNGHVVPVGEAGEVCTRGTSTMLGYWKEPEKTAAVVSPSGWYHTGDLGTMDANGYLKIGGRMKDMIIRGGENIYPVELEQNLYEHPKIKEVQIIGVPDKRLGEHVCACIQTKEGETLTNEEVKSFCRDRMARFKVPHYILFLEQFPKTVSGKIQKYMLREQSIKMLGLNTS